MEDEHSDLAKGTWSFLRIVNEYVIQPLFTVSTSKVFKIKETLVLTPNEEIGLQWFCEINIWLLNDWCPHTNEFSLKNVQSDAIISSVQRKK